MTVDLWNVLLFGVLAMVGVGVAVMYRMDTQHEAYLDDLFLLVRRGWKLVDEPTDYSPSRWKSEDTYNIVYDFFDAVQLQRRLDRCAAAKRTCCCHTEKEAK